ncbi:MAG: RagB/SusD family nutrient uptake outer membrane protein, partial [Alistipes sp.]|nr:RagB/SusD family nutrient uptake outer membrane protein [Alistipes sp.]
YNETNSETIFSSEETAEMFVEGCYRNMISKETYYQLGSGDSVIHASEDAAGGSKNSICNFFYDTKTPYTLTTSYSEAYRIIEATNIGIEWLSKMAESDKRNALLAECYCIRAFMYYNVLRIYGDMPAVWQPMETMDPEAEATFFPKRAPRDEIYDRIIADMQGSIDFLPTKAEGAYGGSVQRLTRDGAYALLARIALYAAGYSLRWDLETLDPASMKVARRSDETRVRELYQIASDACEKVMSMAGNGLVQPSGTMTAFQNLWFSYDSRSFATSNLEMLWQQACYGTNTNSDFNRYAHPGCRYGIYGTEKAMQIVLPTYYLSFDDNDQRRDVTCTPYSSYSMTGENLKNVVLVGTTYSCITLGKFRQQWRVQSVKAAVEMNMDIPILRYADVLLGYAEAQNFLFNGPTAAAKDALQQVRARAGIGDMPIPSEMDAFTEALAQERKWEFAGELWLRTDLIRMGQLSKQVTATQTAMRQLSAQESIYSNTPTY